MYFIFLNELNEGKMLFQCILRPLKKFILRYYIILIFKIISSFPNTPPAYSDNYINNIIKSIIFKIAYYYKKKSQKWKDGIIDPIIFSILFLFSIVFAVYYQVVQMHV